MLFDSQENNRISDEIIFFHQFKNCTPTNCEVLDKYFYHIYENESDLNYTSYCFVKEDDIHKDEILAKRNRCCKNFRNLHVSKIIYNKVEHKYGLASIDYYGIGILKSDLVNFCNSYGEWVFKILIGEYDYIKTEKYVYNTFEDINKRVSLILCECYEHKK